MKPGTAATRPWGPAPWLMRHLKRDWSLLGCLGPEERSLGMLEFLHDRKELRDAQLLEVLPVQTSRFYALASARLNERRAQLATSGLNVPISPMALFSSDQDIVEAADSFIASSSAHVILDISALPKRFFFPLVRRLLRPNRLETVVVTYSVPETYGRGDLAEDHQPFTHLPLFGPSSFPQRRPEIVIVSAGFMKLGLGELLEPYKTVSIRTIVPFPPGPPSYFRNLDFVRDIEKALPQGIPDPIRVEAYDCVDAFDHIAQLCDQGRRPCILAPYGPKPISLAMALYASLSQDVVLYTQPTAYDPFYSTGIKKLDGLIEAHAYVLRSRGTNLYKLGT